MKKSNKSIILSATATSWIYQAVAAINGLIALPLIVSNLGKTEFGIWTLIIQTIHFMTMSDLGVTNALGRFVAHSRGLNDKEATIKVYSSTMAFLVFICILITFITLVLSQWIGNIIGIEKSYFQTAKTIFIISGLTLALQSPLNISVGILTGHQLYGPHGIGKILGSILNIAGVIILYNLRMIELIPLAIVNAASILISQTLLLYVAWKLTNPWSLKLKNVSLKLMANIISFGGSTLTVTITNLIYRSGLIIAVGRILGTQAAGLYGIVFTLISHIHPLLSSFSNPLTTLASEFLAKDMVQNLKKIAKLIMRSTFALSSCVTAGLFIYSESIFRILIPSASKWTSSDLYQASNMVSIMSIGMTIGLPQVISLKILQGVGKHWQVTYSSLVNSVLSLLAGIFLMHTALGIYGAACGWSIFWIFQGVLFYPVMICKYLKITLMDMIVKSYLPGAAVGLFVLLLTWAINYFIGGAALFNLIIGIGLSAILGLIIIFDISGYRESIIVRIIRRFI